MKTRAHTSGYTQTSRKHTVGFDIEGQSGVFLVVAPMIRKRLFGSTMWGPLVSIVRDIGGVD